MKNILLIESSPRGSDSYSHQAARSIVNDFIGGMYAASEQRTPDQARSIALSDTLIDELFAADTIVIAAPMHNFGVPSTLKAWIDHISRAGRTFSYGANGPQGLLKDKQVILVLASGGVYSNGHMKAFDFTEPYLRAVFGFLGITDVEAVRVEGVAMSAIGPEKALTAANTQSKQLVAGLA